jgi:hypothetical protein
LLAAVWPWIGVLILAAASTGLLLSRDWRWDLALLAAQYLGVASLVVLHWPIGMAAAKLVAGWMATAAIGMTLTAQSRPEIELQKFWPQGRPFRLFMTGMVFVVTAAATPRVEGAMAGVEAPIIAGALMLTGMGLLQLGIRSDVPHVIFGLLTVLAGFEIFYAAIEGSILVAGLLAAVNLGLGLTGAYLLTATTEGDSG